MALPPRLFPGDEELGKKYDDHQPGSKGSLGAIWQHRRLGHGPHRRTLKRLALGALAFITVFYFFRNMPTDMENPRVRPHYDHSSRDTTSGIVTRPPPVKHGSAPQSVHDETAVASRHYFNGPIRFHQLASTLREVSRAKGSDSMNRNIASFVLLTF